MKSFKTSAEASNLLVTAKEKFSNRIENDAVSVDPSHVKISFENFKTQVIPITVWNKTKSYLRFRLILPQTDLFQVYCDQFGINANSRAIVYVKCKPQETQIVVDYLEIQVEGHAGLLIPLEILPSTEWFVLPKFLTLPPTSLQQRVEANIGLPQPKDKIYHFSIVSPVTSSFSVEPRNGSIGGPDGVTHIKVTFQAHEYITLVYILRIKFHGVDSQPYDINICGRCIPNPEGEKLAKDAIEIEGVGAGEFKKKPKKPRQDKVRQKASTKQPNQEATVAKSSLDLFTPSGIMKFLIKKDDDSSKLLGPLGVDLSKSLATYRAKRDEFLAERFKYEVQQKSLAVQHHREHVGEMSLDSCPEKVEEIKSERQRHWSEYMKATGMTENSSEDLSRVQLEKSNQRPIRLVGQFHELKYNNSGFDETQYLHDLYRMKRAILRRFVNAARIIVTRWRVDQRLKNIRKLVARRRAEIDAGHETVVPESGFSAPRPTEYLQTDPREYPTTQELDEEKIRMKYRKQELKTHVDKLNTQLRKIRDAINHDLEKIKSRAQNDYFEEETSDAESLKKFSGVQDMTTYLQRIDKAICRLQSKLTTEPCEAEQRALTTYILSLMGLVTSEELTEDASKYLKKYMISFQPQFSPLKPKNIPSLPKFTKESQQLSPPFSAEAKPKPEVTVSSGASKKDVHKVVGQTPANSVHPESLSKAIKGNEDSSTTLHPSESHNLKLLDLEDSMDLMNDGISGIQALIHDPQLRTIQARLSILADELRASELREPSNYFLKKYLGHVDKSKFDQTPVIMAKELNDSNSKKIGVGDRPYDVTSKTPLPSRSKQATTGSTETKPEETKTKGINNEKQKVPNKSRIAKDLKDIDEAPNNLSHMAASQTRKLDKGISDGVAASPHLRYPKRNETFFRAIRRAVIDELGKLEKMLNSPEIGEEQKQILSTIDEELLPYGVATETEITVSEETDDDERRTVVQKPSSSRIGARKYTAAEIKNQLIKSNQAMARLQDEAKSPKIGKHIAKINGLVEKALVDQPNDEDPVTSDLKTTKEIIGREVNRLSTLLSPRTAEAVALHGHRIKREIDRVIGNDLSNDPEAHLLRNILDTQMWIIKNRTTDPSIGQVLANLSEAFQKMTSKNPQGPIQEKKIRHIQTKLQTAAFTPSQLKTINKINSNIELLTESQMPLERLEETRNSVKRQINKLQYDTSDPEPKIVLAELNWAIDEPPVEDSKGSPSEVFQLYHQLESLLPKSDSKAQEAAMKTRIAIDDFIITANEMELHASMPKLMEEQQRKLRNSIQEAEKLARDESAQKTLKEINKKIEGTTIHMNDIKSLQKRLSEHFARLLLTSNDPRVKVFMEQLNSDMDETEKLQAKAAKQELVKRKYRERLESLKRDLYGLRSKAENTAAPRLIDQLVERLGTVRQTPLQGPVVHLHQQRSKLNELLNVPKYAADAMILSALKIINSEIDKLLGRSVLPKIYRSEPSLFLGGVTASMPRIIKKSESVPVDIHRLNKEDAKIDKNPLTIKAQLRRVNAEIDALQKHIMNRAINENHLRLNEIVGMLLDEPSNFKPWMIDQNVIQVVPSSLVLQHRQRINSEIDRLQERLGSIDLSSFKEDLNAEIDKVLGIVTTDERRALLPPPTINKVEIPQHELAEHRRSIMDAVRMLANAIPGFDRKSTLLEQAIQQLFMKFGLRDTSVVSERGGGNWQKIKVEQHKQITDELFDLVGGNYGELLMQSQSSAEEEEEELGEAQRHEDTSKKELMMKETLRQHRLEKLGKLQRRINAEYEKLQNKLRNIDLYKNQVKLNEIIDQLAVRDYDDPESFRPRPITDLKRKKSLKVSEKTLRRLHIGVLIPIGSLQYQFAHDGIGEVENELNAIMRSTLKQIIPNIKPKEINEYFRKVQRAFAKLKRKLPEFQAEAIEEAVQEVVEKTLEKLGTPTGEKMTEEKTDSETIPQVLSAIQLGSDGTEEEFDGAEEEGLEAELLEEEEAIIMKESEVDHIRRSINRLLDTLQLKTYDPEVPRQKSFFNAHLDRFLGMEPEPVQKKDAIQVITDVTDGLEKFKENLPQRRKETIDAIQDVLTEIKIRFPELIHGQAGKEDATFEASKTHVSFNAAGKDHGKDNRKKGKDKRLKKIRSAPEIAISSPAENSTSDAYGGDADGQPGRTSLGGPSTLESTSDKRRSYTAKESRESRQQGSDRSRSLTRSAERSTRTGRSRLLQKSRSESSYMKTSRSRSRASSKLQLKTFEKTASHVNSTKKLAASGLKKFGKKLKEKLKTVEKVEEDNGKEKQYVSVTNENTVEIPSEKQETKPEDKQAPKSKADEKTETNGATSAAINDRDALQMGVSREEVVASKPAEKGQKKVRGKLQPKAPMKLHSKSAEKMGTSSQTKLKASRKDKASGRLPDQEKVNMDAFSENLLPEEVESTTQLYAEDDGVRPESDFEETIALGEDSSSMLEKTHRLSRDEVLEYQDRINRALNEIQSEAEMPAVAALQDRFNEEIIDLLNAPSMSELTGSDAKGVLALLEVTRKVFELQDMARNPDLDGPAHELEAQIRKIAEDADVKGHIPPLLPDLQLEEHGHRLPVLMVRDFRLKINKRFSKVPEKLMTEEILKTRDAINAILNRMEEEIPKDIVKNNLYKLNQEINALQGKVANADIAHHQDTMNAYVLYLIGLPFKPELVNIKNVVLKHPSELPLAFTPEQIMYHQKRIHCNFEALPVHFKTAKLRAIFEKMNDKITSIIGTVKQNRAKTFIDKYNNEIDIIQRHIMQGDLGKLQDELIEEFQSILNWTDVRWTPFREHTFAGVQLPRNFTPADTKKYKDRLIIAYTDIPSDAKSSRTHDLHRKILAFLDNLTNRPASPEEYLVMETSELQEKITNEIREIQTRLIFQVHQLDSPDQKLDILKLNKFQWKINMELGAIRDRVRYEIQKYYEKVKHHPKKIKYRRTHLKTIKSLQENAAANIMNLQEVINQFIDQFRKRFSDDAKDFRRQKKTKKAPKKDKHDRKRKGRTGPCAKFGLKCVRIRSSGGSKSVSKSRMTCGREGVCALKIHSSELLSKNMASKFGISLPTSNTRIIDAWNVATEKRMQVPGDQANTIPSLQLHASSVALLDEARKHRMN